MIKETRMIMGMPVTLMVHDRALSDEQIKKVFAIFTDIDKKYSPYKESSEVSRLAKIPPLKRHYSHELAGILKLAEETKRSTKGYFDVEHNSVFDPSGIVKGWAIQKAADTLSRWTHDFYIEAGGDIQVSGTNEEGSPWHIGVRNPFERSEHVVTVRLEDAAIATSGTAIRGAHIYDPINNSKLTSVVSISVIAPRIVDADRMATAAFAMGERGIYFIENLPGYEAYMINEQEVATQTTGWEKYEETV